MISKIFFGIFLIISLSFCAPPTWSMPKVIASNIQATTFGSPLELIDSTTQNTHVFYCGTEKGLYHIVIDSMGIAKEPQILDINSHCYAISAEISQDNKNIYIAEGIMKDGIEDILFIESSNSGNTWTNPVKIPRAPENEKFPRSAPSLNINPITNKLWIFYSRQLSSVSRHLFCVSRPYEESAFSLEEAIQVENNLPYYVKSAITHVDQKSEIHLFWNDNAFTSKNTILYSKSIDDGKTWESPISVSNLTRISSVFSHDSLISYAYAMPSRAHLFKISKDNGLNWSKEILLSQITGKTLSSQCKCKERHYILTEELVEPTKFGVYDENKQMFIPGPIAFRELKDVNSPVIVCYVDDKLKGIVVRAVAAYGASDLYTTSIIFPQ